jgi:hypothetical protein
MTSVREKPTDRAHYPRLRQRWCKGIATDWHGTTAPRGASIRATSTTCLDVSLLIQIGEPGPQRTVAVTEMKSRPAIRIRGQAGGGVSIEGSLGRRYTASPSHLHPGGAARRGPDACQGMSKDASERFDRVGKPVNPRGSKQLSAPGRSPRARRSSECRPGARL